jgi:tRNA uridine 5-carboxymethylaminomethyl modification enzyme
MPWTYPESYDVIVIGGGHAGCEASLASARMGQKTLLLTMTIESIAKMSCNPAIGGIGKGHIVREIDALGGEMGKVSDATGIQFRMLNASKGPAVWAPRCQSDKIAYQNEMRHRLEQVPNLQIKNGTCEELVIENGQVTGVITKEGILYNSKAVILTSGTFLRGLMHIGEVNFQGGRLGDAPSNGLSDSLKAHGIELKRLKTGTPPRVHRRSIDYSLCEEQPGEDHVTFSFDGEKRRLPQVSCFITYTNEETKRIILENVHRSPMYSGKIKATGVRYCPSIEDKMVRFAHRDRHQVFLEPEGLQTEEIYLNGISSSLPYDVQIAYVRSIPALRNAEIMRPAYAIEYDYAVSGQISAGLESYAISSLFFAGQINGTTGYEEAAAQGLMAGINAALKVQGKEPFILKRSEAYIGVLIDDLITKKLEEPYRMFTSRAEHRLLLRQDNADLRVRRYGYELGLVDQKRYDRLLEKESAIEKEIARWQKVFKTIDGKSCSLGQLICRSDYNYKTLLEAFPHEIHDFGEEINQQIEWTFKYKGYIERQNIEVARLENVENIKIPAGFDFKKVVGLRSEAREKLLFHKPDNLGQASRILGVTFADISIIMINLKRRQALSASIDPELDELEPAPCC